MKKRHSLVGLGSVVCIMAAAGAMAQGGVRGPEWIEKGDAGELPGGAQNTVGKGKLLGIRGNLGDPFRGIALDLVDMYWIHIDDPEAFRASTVVQNEGFAEFASALYLFTPQFLFRSGGGFDVDGFGLLGNLFEEAGQTGSTLRQFSTDNSGAFVRDPGLYLLAITFDFNLPVSQSGEMFFFENPFEISGPDGPGGGDPIIGWREEDGGDGGGERAYRIALEGVSFANVPAPGAISLLAVAALVSRRRRRA